jgi:serine/threonine protein kinase
MLRSQVDWRSDIYAIGILAYEMVTGESPFRGDSVYATMTKRLRTDPESPSNLRPECPPALDKVILKAMHRDPQLRYQSAMEIFFDLQRIATEQGMRTALTGGFFLPNQISPGYVGPSVSSGTEDNSAFLGGSPVATAPAAGGMNAGAAASGVAAAGGGLASAWRDSNGTSGSSAVGGRPRSGSSFTDYDSSNGHEAQAGTQVLGAADMVELTTDVSSGPANGKLDSVLGRDDLVSDGWMESEQVTVGRGDITSRVRDLSHKYHEQHARRSYMMDAIALFVAMIIGIGFGCVVLKLFFPSLLASMPFFRG